MIALPNKRALKYWRPGGLLESTLVSSYIMCFPLERNAMATTGGGNNGLGDQSFDLQQILTNASIGIAVILVLTGIIGGIWYFRRVRMRRRRNRSDDDLRYSSSYNSGFSFHSDLYDPYHSSSSYSSASFWFFLYSYSFAIILFSDCKAKE